MVLRGLRGLLGVSALLFLALLLPAAAQLSHPTQISGRVLDADNQPVAAIVVEVHSWNGATLASQMTNAAGRFDFMLNSTGPLQLEVGPDGDSNPLPLYGNNQMDLQIKLPGSATPAGRTLRPTISLNDLEASGKAKSKLAEADKALRKLDLAKAWKFTNEAIAAAPNWGRAYLVRGVLSMESHNYSSAQHDLATAVERDPHSAVALTELGKLYATTGQLQLSDLYLRRALTMPPVLWPTYFEMANLDLKRGNFAEAEQMATYAEFCTPPAPPTSHFLAAEAAYHLHDWRTAQVEYRSFLALSTPTPQLARALATAHDRLQQIAAAQSAARH